MKKFTIGFLLAVFIGNLIASFFLEAVGLYSEATLKVAHSLIGFVGVLSFAIVELLILNLEFTYDQS